MFIFVVFVSSYAFCRCCISCLRNLSRIASDDGVFVGFKSLGIGGDIGGLMGNSMVN